MAFSATTMNRIQAGTHALWFYRSATDNNATVQGAGYFNSYAAHLTVGDLIFISSSNEPDVVMVSSNDGATVGITALNIGA